MDTSEIDITDLIGDQSSTSGDVYFRIPVIGQAGQTVDFALQRVVCAYARAYYSIDEILEDAALLPANIRKDSVNSLKKFIAADSRRGFGSKVIGYDLVAYSGKSAYDRPIACIKTPTGDVRYYASPYFQNAVKKI